MMNSQDSLSLPVLLGLHRHFGTVLCDGRVFRLERSGLHRSSQDHIRLCGGTYSLRTDGDIYSRMARSLDAGHASAPTAYQDAATFRQCLRFVYLKLIPALISLSNASGKITRFQTPYLIEGAELIHRHLGARVLILGQNVYPISAPAVGDAPGEGFVRLSKTALRIDMTKRELLMSADARFRADLHRMIRSSREKATGLPGESPPASPLRDSLVLYKDPHRRVLRDCWGGLYCCQQVPGFAMEDARGQLRLFEQVEVGVKLFSLAPEEVLDTGGAYVMSPYEHLFVFNAEYLGRLCLGHDYHFFQRFWSMPLERGILEYLNAARLVLCAGHFDSEDLWQTVPEAMARRPILSFEEARARRIPIYRYYRTSAIS